MTTFSQSSHNPRRPGGATGLAPMTGPVPTPHTHIHNQLHELLLVLVCWALGFNLKPKIKTGLGKVALKPLLALPLLMADIPNQLWHSPLTEPTHSFFTQGTKQPAVLALDTQLLCHIPGLN